MNNARGKTFYRKFFRYTGPLIKLYHRAESFGAENLPPAGAPFILAPNHTNWFGWDALLLSSILEDHEVSWVSWDYEEELPLWHRAVALFDPIFCGAGKQFPYRRVCEEVLGRGGVVGIFPEGNNNTMKDWYRLRPFFPGCVRLAVLSGAPVVPVSVAGIEEASPIILAKETPGEPITDIVAPPFPLPTKAVVRFGAPFHPRLNEADLGSVETLQSAARDLQLRVLELLRNDRPGARAES